jgi:acetyl esterase
MATDYAELRERRLAEVDAETRQGFEAAAEMLRIREMGVPAFREVFAQVMNMVTPGMAPGVDAETISIPGPAGEIPVRIYRPADHDGPLGVYVHTHGGGFIAWNGMDAIDGANSRSALEWGCAVVHPDFRVPPEDPFPAAVEDCWATVQWVAEHGREYGIDPERIAVGGGCTGANFAAVMALMARDAGSPKIALQFLDSPQLDTRCDYRSFYEFGEGFGLSRDADLFVVEQYLSDPEDRWDWRASPILVDSVRGVAPAIVTAGEYEILRDEARLYAGRLRDAGVEVLYIEGPRQGHGFSMARNPETGEYAPGAAAARAQIGEVFRRHIGKPPDGS